MSLRLFTTLLVTLVAGPVLAQHSQPVSTFESGFQCFPYLPCSSPSMCEQPGIPACGTLVTGEQACVPSANTRYNLVCCQSNTECVDVHGNQGTCRTINQPPHESFNVCIWDAPGTFCRSGASDVRFIDFEACAGEVPGEGDHTLAQKLLVGDCDGDEVTNEFDVCPCAFSDTTADGCPEVVDEDAGVPTDGGNIADGSTPDATSSDSGTRTDSGSAANPFQFGGGGGCEGCAAGGESAGDLSLILLVLAALFARGRHAR